jgi:hypothetical protein
VYLTAKFAHERRADSLGDYQVLAAAQQVLSSDRPVWATLRVAGGAIILLFWLTSAVSKAPRKARKAVGI